MVSINRTGGCLVLLCCQVEHKHPCFIIRISLFSMCTNTIKTFFSVSHNKLTNWYCTSLWKKVSKWSHNKIKILGSNFIWVWTNRDKLQPCRVCSRQEAVIWIFFLLTCVQELIKCIQLLQTLILDHRLKIQTDLDRKKLDYFEGKCELVLQKIKWGVFSSLPLYILYKYVQIVIIISLNCVGNMYFSFWHCFPLFLSKDWDGGNSAGYIHSWLDICS